MEILWITKHKMIYYRNNPVKYLEKQQNIKNNLVDHKN